MYSRMSTSAVPVFTRVMSHVLFSRVLLRIVVPILTLSTSSTQLPGPGPVFYLVLKNRISSSLDDCDQLPVFLTRFKSSMNCLPYFAGLLKPHGHGHRRWHPRSGVKGTCIRTSTKYGPGGVKTMTRKNIYCILCETIPGE